MWGGFSLFLFIQMAWSCLGLLFSIAHFVWGQRYQLCLRDPWMFWVFVLGTCWSGVICKKVQTWIDFIKCFATGSIFCNLCLIYVHWIDDVIFYFLLYIALQFMHLIPFITPTDWQLRISLRGTGGLGVHKMLCFLLCGAGLTSSFIIWKICHLVDCLTKLCVFLFYGAQRHNICV